MSNDCGSTMNERIQELADKAAADFPGIPDQFGELAYYQPFHC